MNAPAVLAPAAPTASPRPSLRHAFGGIWRLTMPRLFVPRHLFGVAVGLALLGLFSWGFAHSGHGPAEYLAWAIGFYFTFVLPLVAFVGAGGAMRDEMKASSIDYVLTRPIPRPAFVAFKYVAYVVGAELEFLPAFAVVVTLGLKFGAAGLVAAIPALLLAQVLVVLGAAAFGFLCAVVTSRYVVVGLVYGAIVEIGVGQIPTELNRLSMTHEVKAMLQPFLVPSGSPATTALEAIQPVGQITTVALLIAFAAVAIGAAATLFSFRELTGSNDA